MTLELAVVLLTYLLLLVMTYMMFILLNEKEKRSYKIINKSYQNAYSILFFSILIVYTLVKLPHIPLDSQTRNYLILASKFISVLTLGGSIFILRRTKMKK